MQYIIYHHHQQIATITLNRIHNSNAFNFELLKELLSAINQSTIDKSRVLIIKANGRNFCSGADIKEMQQAHIVDSQEESKLLMEVLLSLQHLTYPSIAITHGKTFGGGLGIIAASDVVIAHPDSMFCFSEAKLGLIPAVISPFVTKSIGNKNAKKLFITTELFNANEALRYGLVDIITDDYNNYLNTTTSQIIANSANAITEIKELFNNLDLQANTEQLQQQLINKIVELKSSQDAKERMQKFINKTNSV